MAIFRTQKDRGNSWVRPLQSNNWKYPEGISQPLQLNRFCGKAFILDKKSPLFWHSKSRIFQKQMYWWQNQFVFQNKLYYMLSCVIKEKKKKKKTKKRLKFLHRVSVLAKRRAPCWTTLNYVQKSLLGGILNIWHFTDNQNRVMKVQALAVRMYNFFISGSEIYCVFLSVIYGSGKEPAKL